MTRFLALRWAPARNDLARQARGCAEQLEAEAGLSRLLEWRGLIVLASGEGEALLELPHGVGFVFGLMFARGREGADAVIRSVSYEDAIAWAERGGASLFHEVWGAYVAFLIDREHDRLHVLRDPVGAEACYLGKLGEIRCIFSAAADFVLISDCAPRPERVRAFLAMPHLVVRETALAGVEELLPGERLTAGRDFETIDLLWRPPRTAAADQEFAAAVSQLRRELEACVAAWASVRPKILHRLSGGLDSSAVLALLRRTKDPDDILCINETSAAAPEGDERAMARAVCAHFGVELHEMIIDPQDVCFERALEAPLMASPSMTVLSFAQNAYADLDSLSGEAIMTSGQGGDQVFHRTRSTLVAAEAARRAPAPWVWAPIAYDAARLSGQSFWRVAGDALKHGLMRMPAEAGAFFQPGAEMARAARESAHREQLAHPWLAGRRAGPCQTGRILSLLQAQHYHWPNALSARFAAVNPLLSQPVIEFILNIPAHVLTEGGRDRALYRAAVADLLPPQVLYRTTKGQTTRHFAEVATRNRTVLREVLLDGELCAEGIVERTEMEEALRRAEITTLGQMDNVLIAFAAEAWLCSWKRVRKEHAAMARM